MGNRGVITTKDKEVGVYLHWNGGRDSVEAFLKYCKLKGYRAPESDNYGWARLCQVIGNFFGGETSVGVDRFERIEHSASWGNGVYIIENWEVVGREQFDDEEQDDHELYDMLVEINMCQPMREQLNDDVLRSAL